MTGSDTVEQAKQQDAAKENVKKPAAVKEEDLVRRRDGTGTSCSFHVLRSI